MFFLKFQRGHQDDLALIPAGLYLRSTEYSHMFFLKFPCGGQDELALIPAGLCEYDEIERPKTCPRLNLRVPSPVRQRILFQVCASTSTQRTASSSKTATGLARVPSNHLFSPLRQASPSQTRRSSFHADGWKAGVPKNYFTGLSHWSQASGAVEPPWHLWLPFAVFSVGNWSISWASLRLESGAATKYEVPRTQGPPIQA